MGFGGLSPRIKKQEHEADSSPPTIAKPKKTWIHTSTPTYVFTA
jgi:hypothetical protein